MLETSKRNLKGFNIIGFLFAILGTIVFIVLVGLAHYYAHEVGFIIRDWELSELVLESNKAKILFNTGIIIYGVSLLIALIPSINFFKEHNKHKIFIPLAIITCLSLIGVGIFSEDQFSDFHYIVAIIFYFSGGALVTYASIIFLKYDTSIPLFYPIVGFTAVIMLIFNVVTRWFFGQAYTQRIAICFFILFFLLISGKILLRKDTPSREENQN